MSEELSERMREAIVVGLKSFEADQPDFAMSSAMRASAADHILAQPGMWGDLPPRDLAVREAVEKIANNYQTSDQHHPDHVLIRSADFLNLCAEAGVIPHSEDGFIERRRAAILHKNSPSSRPWFPHLDFAGEPMREGQFREPWPMEEETNPAPMKGK